MNKTIKIRLIIILSGFFLFFDQWLKWQATHIWTKKYLINNHLGWQPFLNQKAALGLPIPNSLIIFLTIIIIILILLILKKEYRDNMGCLAWAFVLAGAFSNLFDRIYHGYVIDYFSFVTGIINLADILIMAGLLIYVLNQCLLIEKKT